METTFEDSSVLAANGIDCSRLANSLNSWSIGRSTMEEESTHMKPKSKGLNNHGCKQRSCWPVSYVVVFIVLAFLTSTALATPNKQVGNNHRAGSRHIHQGHQQQQKKPRTYLNQFAVNLLDGNEETARSLATKYGFIFKGQIGSLDGWYMFEDKRVFKRSIHIEHNPLASHLLAKDPMVSIVDRQAILSRPKRNRRVPPPGEEGPNDPAWRKMWYMHCGGVDNSVCPTSMRISDAWRAGYSGEGVVVTILDDGIETNHPDLRMNYDANASYDINGLDHDPTPRYDYSNENKHGTRCAGVVAAVSDNRICSVGIAYRAKIGGIRMLDGEVTDNVEAQSLGYSNDYIDIYSASWGPDDDGNTVEGPGYLAKAAFKEGASRGRGGKGSIFVWASGNGGHNRDTCACDGYINSIYTIGISSVSQGGKRPWYLESCASTLATTYSSGEVDEGKIITTDLHGSCTYAHTGTSASAPMAAGVIALMLDANQNLTWRDVQHIIVRTSNPYGLQADDWIVNGAGYNVSHVFGFGLMDAAKLTHVSRTWRTVPEQKQCENFPDSVPRMLIRTSRPLELHLDANACHGRANEVNHLEHVILRITLSHVRRGDLQIFLTSPAGTKSTILERRNLDRSNAGFDEWDFMTTHHWGENPQGVWTLEIKDLLPARPRYRDHTFVNRFTKWQLIFYGTNTHPQLNFQVSSCDAFPQDHCHAQCEGCCGASQMECKRCRNVSTFTGECISECPPHHFAHPVTKICQPCYKTCDECTGPYEDNCAACAVGFTLLEGRCVKQCAQGSFLDAATDRCLTCHASCRTCADKRDKCTTCRPGFEKIGNSCEASCPRGTFLLSYESGCSFCHHYCSECTGPNPSHCTTCAEGMILHKKRCVDTCPKKFYRARQSCKACHRSCRTCDGPLATDCLSCNPDHNLREGECRRVCRDAFYRRAQCITAKSRGLCNNRHWAWQCCGTCSGVYR